MGEPRYDVAGAAQHDYQQVNAATWSQRFEEQLAISIAKIVFRSRSRPSSEITSDLGRSLARNPAKGPAGSPRFRAQLAWGEDTKVLKFVRFGSNCHRSIVCSERNQISNQTELRGDWTFRCEASERTPSFPANISRRSQRSASRLNAPMLFIPALGRIVFT